MSAALRLFFGLSPDYAAREALSRAAARLSFKRGKLYAKDLYHLTLVFLGQTDSDRVDELLTAADEAFDAPFSLTLSPGIGSFKRESVIYAGVEPDERLVSLRNALRENLAARGFPAGDEEFTPHITLGRNMRLTAPAPEVESVAFPVRRITLFESVRDGGRLVYRPLSRTGGGRNG